MEIILVRHGIAEEPAEASLEGRGDAERALTAEGREKTAEVAQAFARRVKAVDLIVHSPYRRAVETAEIFGLAFPRAGRRAAQELRPHDDPERGAALLAGLKAERVMVVGHNPFLSLLASYLLAGDFSLDVTFKKAGLAGLEWGGPGNSRLLYLIPPKMLLV
jgi:phosphohistidine phosphatase